MTTPDSIAGKIHIINHHIWPDGSPICLITEQTAQYLTQQNVPVVVVGSGGKYRSSSRSKPDINFVTLKTKLFKRQNVFQNMMEYLMVLRAFWQYIRENVHDHDTLILTSAPPSNVLLRYALHKRKVKTVFWLFDYFPGYLFPLGLPTFIYGWLRRWWDGELSRYDYVIKIAGNLGYYGENVRTFRLWPTMLLHSQSGIGANKALYSGNLGMAHDVNSLVTICEELRDRNFEIDIYADGPGTKKLPDWLKARLQPLLAEEDYKKALANHDVHIVAGTPNVDELSFPSKTWNSIAAGKQIIPCGFFGKMQREFDLSLTADHTRHLPNLADYLTNLHYQNTLVPHPAVQS